MKHFVYCITFPNGKLYIGKTCHVIARMRAHLSRAKHGYDLPVYRAMRKYAISADDFEILESFDTEQEALECEKYFIALAKSTVNRNGYNVTVGGEGSSGTVQTEESKKLISLANSKSIIRSDGKVFSCGLDAAKEMGVIPATISAVLKGRNKSCQGYGFKYYDGSTPASFEIPEVSHKRTAITYNGITYRSLSEAARSLGIPKTTFCRQIGRYGR